MSLGEFEQDEGEAPKISEIGQFDIPEAMQWLMGAFRLIDLHDLARTPGATTQGISVTRPGTENRGLWLDVGLQLLSYLANQDLNNPGSFVPLAPFTEMILGRHPEINEDDILFVVRMLCRPTSIWCRPGEYSERSDTAFQSKDAVLVERSRTGELVRLAKRGHQAVQISQAAREWIYTGDISVSIVKALEWNDFPKAVALCRQMVRSINIEAEYVTRAVEQPGMDSLRLFYIEFRERYQETMRSALDALDKARNRVASQQCWDGYQEYVARTGKDAVLWWEIEGGLKSLLQTLQGFMDTFVECINAIQKRDAGFIQPIDFLQLSLRMAVSPLNEDAQRTVMDLLVPNPPQTIAPHPIDFRSFIATPVRKENSVRTIFPARDESATLQLERWLEREAKRLESRLNEGPLSLDDAFKEGFFPESTLSIAAEIISEMHAPPLFRVGNMRVVIGLKGDVHLDLDDGEIFGGNIVIMKADERET